MRNKQLIIKSAFWKNVLPISSCNWHVLSFRKLVNFFLDKIFGSQSVNCTSQGSAKQNNFFFVIFALTFQIFCDISSHVLWLWALERWDSIIDQIGGALWASSGVYCFGAKRCDSAGATSPILVRSSVIFFAFPCLFFYFLLFRCGKWSSPCKLVSSMKSVQF